MIEYVIKVVVCQLLLYLIYQLFLSKEYIIILWVLPEIEKDKVDADFHLQNNLVFDTFLNVGGVILTKTD